MRRGQVPEHRLGIGRIGFRVRDLRGHGIRLVAHRGFRGTAQVRHDGIGAYRDALVADVDIVGALNHRGHLVGRLPAKGAADSRSPVILFRHEGNPPLID